MPAKLTFLEKAGKGHVEEMHTSAGVLQTSCPSSLRATLPQVTSLAEVQVLAIARGILRCGQA